MVILLELCRGFGMLLDYLLESLVIYLIWNKILLVLYPTVPFLPLELVISIVIVSQTVLLFKIKIFYLFKLYTFKTVE